MVAATFGPRKPLDEREALVCEAEIPEVDFDMPYDEDGNPLELEILDPFVVFGQVNGCFARILIDSGCNTVMISDRFVRRCGMRTYTRKGTNVRWGNDGGSFESTAIAAANLSLYTDKPDRVCNLGMRAMLVAPLRVDVIIGTPLIRWVDKRWLPMHEREG